MNALRIKIALLVTGAIVAMSAIGVAAAFSVSLLVKPSGATVVFRYSQIDSQPLLMAPPGQAAEAAAALQPLAALLGPLPLGAVAGVYALLILAGAAAVGVIVANMVVRPLSILEEAVDSVHPEGFIPEVSETGLGETLQAARLINMLSARLRLAMDSRMRLVAAAGHDLRTPMTRMRLRAELIEDDAERDVWIRDIDEIMHIADSAITLVKEESGSAGTEDVDLSALLSDVCSEAAEIGLDAACAPAGPTLVRGSSIALKRAVANLVGNAAIHGGSARATLARAGGEAVIRIVDSGPGIPEEDLDRAFEPFFRASPGRRKLSPGAGLGLAIAKEIVSRHGGTLTLANGKGGGLVQTVRLPAA